MDSMCKDGRVMMILNEEGKINDMKINRRATALYPHNDIIFGDAVLACGVDDELMGFDFELAKQIRERAEGKK